MGNRGHQAKKKQGVPEIPVQLPSGDGKKKKLGSRAIARAKKRRRMVEMKNKKKREIERTSNDSKSKDEDEFVAESDKEADVDSDLDADTVGTIDSKNVKNKMDDLNSRVNGDGVTTNESSDSDNSNSDEQNEIIDGTSIEESGAEKAQLFSDQSDLEDDPMVRKSKELEERADREIQEGELEFQMNIKRSGEQMLKTADEMGIMEAEDPANVWGRVTETIRILSRFSELRDPVKSRSDYVDQLAKDVQTYYGYNAFMAGRIIDMFPPPELLSFLDANENPRPVTIRANLLLTTLRDLHKALVARGMNIDVIGKWTKVGLHVLDSKVALGATPEYICGAYMIQSASSFLSVMALGACENERILDMCASPGGKTTHIAMYMKNTGCIVANDISKHRCKALVANIHRMGVRNAVVSNVDGRKFPKMVLNFDRVLLDAPCTGSGVISKDPTAKISKTEKDLNFLTHTQKELILAAIDSTIRSTGTNGVIVYSTCSILVEENEEVVDYVLNKRPNVQLEDMDLQIGVPAFVSYRGKSFSPSMKLARRIYPHVHNLDGFFVAKLKKISNLSEFAPQKNSETRFQNFTSFPNKTNNSNKIIKKRKNTSKHSTKGKSKAQKLSRK